jgi:two-component system, OmpR family, alkaline phosphatase synthesis response regulator PhoP
VAVAKERTLSDMTKNESQSGQRARVENRPRAHVLVVDDEEDIVALITHNLEREGYGVISALTGEDGLELLKTKKVDLVILDLMLPGIQGLEVCRHIRESQNHRHTPVLILSAKDDEVDRVLGLEIGADDYITKPFGVRELVARVRVALRRAGGHQGRDGEDGRFFHRDLAIDFDKYEVIIRGKRVEPSPIEMKLLTFFARNPGRVYTRDQLLQQVWGEAYVTPRSVDVHISHLRRLIEEDAQQPTYIVTVTGVGYKFDDSHV